MRKIDTIVIHCTATLPGQDVDIDDVRRWHVDGNGWSDVGYHALITLDGQLQFGRDIGRMGAGVAGHNKTTVHVAYVGGVDEDGKPADTMTEKQMGSLHGYVCGIVTVLGAMDVKGHNDFTDAKACPSFNVAEKFPQLVAWASSPVGPWPLYSTQQRQPAPVVGPKYCRKCNRRMRL